MKIFVRQFTKDAGITILPQGDWFDLSVSRDFVCKAGEVSYVPLGVAMVLPDGMEAALLLRSSTPKKYGIYMPIGMGLIDCSYRGNNDEWHAVVCPIGNQDVTLKAGTRICQFRIQPTQRATLIEKLLWLINGKPSFVYKNDLSTLDRGGLGSTN